MEEGMNLNLVHSRLYGYGFAEVQQPGSIEIAYADGPQAAFLVCLLHCPPSADVIAHRLVDQIQIQIIQTQIV